MLELTGIGEEFGSNNAHLSGKPRNLMNWNQYQRLQTIYDYMLDLESLHPEMVKVG